MSFPSSISSCFSNRPAQLIYYAPKPFSQLTQAEKTAALAIPLDAATFKAKFGIDFIDINVNKPLPRLAICETNTVAGRGLFAIDGIPAGTIITVYAGRYLTQNEAEIDLARSNGAAKNYSFLIDSGKTIISAYDCGNASRFAISAPELKDLNELVILNSGITQDQILTANMSKSSISCDNTSLVCFGAGRNIALGEQLAYPYANDAFFAGYELFYLRNAQIIPHNLYSPTKYQIILTQPNTKTVATDLSKEDVDEIVQEDIFGINSLTLEIGKKQFRIAVTKIRDALQHLPGLTIELHQTSKVDILNALATDDLIPLRTAIVQNNYALALRRACCGGYDKIVTLLLEISRRIENTVDYNYIERSSNGYNALHWIADFVNKNHNNFTAIWPRAFSIIKSLYVFGLDPRTDISTENQKTFLPLLIENLSLNERQTVIRDLTKFLESIAILDHKNGNGNRITVWNEYIHPYLPSPSTNNSGFFGIPPLPPTQTPPISTTSCPLPSTHAP